MDHDQLASEKPADQDLHCFQNMRRVKGFRGGSRFSGNGFRCIKRGFDFLIWVKGFRGGSRFSGKGFRCIERGFNFLI